MILFFLFQLVVALAGLVAGAYLWHLGGQGHSWARKWAFPCMLGFIKVFMNLPNFYFWDLLYIPALISLMMMFSYGKTTKIHKFWMWVFGRGENVNNGSHWVEIMTRATCGFFWSLAGVFFVFGGGRIETMVLYSIFLTIANGLIGGLSHNVDFSEKSVGASVSCSLFI